MVDERATAYLTVGDATLVLMTAASLRAVIFVVRNCVRPLPSISISSPKYFTEPTASTTSLRGVHCGWPLTQVVLCEWLHDNRLTGSRQ